MISAQSHQRLLSGNNTWILVLVMFLASCGGTDKAVSKTRSKTKRVDVVTTNPTKSTKDNSSKVDTVEWTEVKDTKKPPFKDEKVKTTTIEKEDVYDITYLLPFKALSYASGTRPAGDKFVQYFAGMEMAEAILEREGISLNINVVDSEKRNIDLVLNSEVTSRTDAIVGLYDTEDLKKAAVFSKENEIPLISPWKASSKITSENPYYIQLRPNLDEYYKAMIKDVVKNYKPEQVFVLGRNTSKDKKMVRYIQRLGKAYFRADEKPFQEIEVEQDSLVYGEAAFDSIFYNDQNNVVIIPNWSFGDESFIYGCTRRLSVEKGVTDMTVYGMEIMLESDKITFDHYSALNMKVARTKFVDESDGDVQRFKQKFFETFGALPTDDAYEGYDNLMFVGRNIHQYGKNFQHFLEKDRGYYLQAAYDVQKTFPKGTKDDSFRDINYFENKHVDIISFDGRRFHRAVDK